MSDNKNKKTEPHNVKKKISHYLKCERKKKKKENKKKKKKKKKKGILKTIRLPTLRSLGLLGRILSTMKCILTF